MSKKTKFREIELKSGVKILLGKDEKSNDELMKQYKGKENTILHTSSPGSPFGVIEDLKPSKANIFLSGAVVANYSQDWRDNKGDVRMDVFTGKDISKRFWMKPGTWKVKKSKKIKIKKKDILKSKNANNRK
jgi:predicted ribosome quality control (RQC) complex YloA/Tae2 family protein|tara:strand:- start:94 stop:489 length:396 start_codon:yes stop_codon:yes gene_type:complete